MDNEQETMLLGNEGADPSSDPPLAPIAAQGSENVNAGLLPAAPKTLTEKIIATIGYLTPQKVQNIAGVWGAPIFIGFVLGLLPGFFGAVVLYKGGWVPTNWIARDYFTGGSPNPSPSPTPDKNTTRAKNTIVTYSVEEKPDLLMQQYEQLINREGQALKDSHQIKEMAIATVRSQSLTPSEPFTWSLEVTQTDFQMWGYATRRTKQGETFVFEPVGSKQDRARSSIHFAVPQCENGDVIYAALIITSPREGSIDFSKAFK